MISLSDKINCCTYEFYIRLNKNMFSLVTNIFCIVADRINYPTRSSLYE